MIIDLLFVVIGFIFYVLVWKIVYRYHYWSEWDRDRRRQRKHYRLDFQDKLAEEAYIHRLRREFWIIVFTVNSEKFQSSVEKAIEATKNFNKILKLEEKL